MLLLDGLLDAAEDLELISLTLKCETHAALTHQALFRPPTLTPSTHAPKLPPPTLEPTTPAALLAHRHICSNNATLHVPPLRVPWASALVDAMYKHLGVKLRTSSLRSTIYFTHSTLETLKRGNKQSPPWKHLQQEFYSSLSPEEEAYNTYVLTYINQVMPPLALQRISVCTKLNFISILHRFLQTHPPPPPLRKPGILVEGRWLRDGAPGAGNAYLLHGVPIPRRLVLKVSALLAERYAVQVNVGTAPRRQLHCGSLASLSNAGMAMLDAPEIRLPVGRGPICLGGLEGYLGGRFGVGWKELSAELMREAEGFDGVGGEVERVREELVARAIRLEVVGAPLSRICAFVLVREGEEVEERLKGFSEEYRDIVRRARGRVEMLQTGVAECF